MELQKFRDALESEAIKGDEMKMTRQQALAQSLCAVCGEPALPKCYSEAGRREFRISGTCEKCFYAMFAEDEGAPEVHTLTELQYVDSGEGPWALYIYGHDGMHSGKKWFRRGTMKYPDEEITIAEAHKRVDEAIAKQYEVRICDGGDMLVFHSACGQILYPESGRDFWFEVEA
jgi:hypothetical protein